MTDVEDINKINNVLSFKEKQYKEMAKEFVRIYTEDGIVAASNYSKLHIGRENYNKLRKYVQDEFLEQGWGVHRVKSDGE